MIENNIIICVFLWSIFGFQHSFLARPSTKQIIARIFGGVFETHFYPIVYFLSQCIMFFSVYDVIRHLKPTIIFYEFSEQVEVLVFWLNRFANVFLILTVFHFNIGKFIGVTQIFEFVGEKFNFRRKGTRTTLLNSSFLYKYVRHPMYLGILLVYATSTTIYTELFFINFLSLLIYVEIGSYFEEKSLVRQFGDQYKNYMKVTKKYFPLVR